MAANLLMLGAIPLARQIGPWLLFQLAAKAKPYAEKFLQDPSGSIARVGDVLVWNGEKGRQVIATLEGLTESQARIEQVVGHIEAAQIGVSSSLGTLASLSMATLGVTSLAAGFMAWRMKALDARLKAIANQISDIQAQLNAQNQAHLISALDFLAKHERSRCNTDLHSALEASTYATRLYQYLVHTELEGRRRLVALNQCGRYYFLALTARARCLILAQDLVGAEQFLTAEKHTLTALAEATFQEVMGKSPEVYLDPNLQADNVTLDLVAEIHRQAHYLGAASGPELRDAGQVFEHFRSRIYGAKSWFRPVGKAKATLLTRLKYLMGCLEDVSRSESLRLRIDEALAKKLSFQELEQAVETSRSQLSCPAGREPEGTIIAFACV